MNGAFKKGSHAVRKLAAICLSIICLFSVVPLEEVTALLNDTSLIYQQIEALVDKKDGGKVSLDGLMPARAKVNAKPIKPKNEAAICSYDITIKKSGKEYQPDSDNPITVKISNKMIAAAHSENHPLELWHIHDDGTREQVEDFTVKNGTLTFTAYGFSVYEVVDGAPPIATYSFYTPNASGNYQKYYFPLDNGEEAYQQSVKNGEYLLLPQLPAFEVKKQTFIGWFEYDPSNGALSAEPYDFTKASNVSSTREVILHAVYSDCAYAVFHDQYNALKDTWPIIATRRGEMKNGSTSVPIDDLSVTYDESNTVGAHSAPQMLFRGWSTTATKTPGTASDVLASPLTINASVDLYPVFSEIRWLTFHTGEDAEYVSPLYIYIDETASSLSVPKRTGYTFAGWYTAESGGTQITDDTGKVVLRTAVGNLIGSNNKLSVTKDTDLYAHWTPSSSHYTVVFWQQSLNDDWDTTSPTYDYYSCHSVSATTGSSATAPNADKNLGGTTGFEQFYFDHADAAKTVAGDGSTVINVYYNRNIVCYHWISSYDNEISEIKGLYGQALSHYGLSWPVGGTNANHIYLTTTFSNTNVTFLYFFNLIKVGNTTAPLDASHTYTVNFDKNLNETKFKIYHHLERMDGSYSNVVDGINCIETNNDKGKFGPTDKFAPDFYIAGYTFGDFTPTYTNSTVNGAEAFYYPTTKTLQNTDAFLTNSANFTTNVLHVYHKRAEHTIQFCDSQTHNMFSERSFCFGEALNNAADGITPIPPREGIEFAGWFYDDEGMIPINFADMTMPSHNLVVYACWRPIRYLIEYDPNGGELANGQRTWYWSEYGGDPIEEYRTTTRKYVEAANGEYLYYYKGYDPNNPSDPGGAYYTDDINSGANVDVAYRYDPDNYYYTQWYEVDPETGDESVYKFGEKVYHDTKLVLHWKELSTFYVRYESGEGSIDGNDSNEEKFVELDDADYADKANVIASRTANPPDGWNFIGWKIRNDPSETIYYQGQSFIFSRSLASTELDENNEIKYTMVLDAVYQQISTTKIIYDANGGTIAANADLGAPTLDPPATEPKYTYLSSTQAEIANLINNSGIQLSDGTGFSYIPEGETQSLEFLGWNTRADCTGTHYDAESIRNYHVDMDEPLTLYAEWGLKLYFDLNNANATWGGSWDPNIYQLDTNTNRYYRTVVLNAPVDEPDIIPVSSNLNESFSYWGTDRYTENVTKYDFSLPITREMILYAYYAIPVNVPIHAVDASGGTLTSKDSTWLTQNSVKVRSGVDTLFASKDDTYSYVNSASVNGYEYVCACASDSVVNVSDISPIVSITYNPYKEKVWLTYDDGSERPMPDDKELYLVYYKPTTRNIPIGYVGEASSGALTTITTRNNPPSSASVNGTAYNMKSRFNANINLNTQYINSTQDRNKYQYYSFAIGENGAANVSGLRLITTPQAVTNTAYPNLYVKDSWNGIQYSADGNTWYTIDDDAKLYVVFYEASPVVVNLSEKTIGYTEDASKEFTYQVVIGEQEVIREQKQTRTGTRRYSWSSNYTYGDWKDEGDPTYTPGGYNTLSSTKYYLSDSESESFTLFQIVGNATSENLTSSYPNNTTVTQEQTLTTIIKYQTIQIIQTEEDNFSTTRKDTPEIAPTSSVYEYFFSSEDSQTDHGVVYTNKRYPEPIELHVAVMENGVITANDSLRSADPSDYELMVAPSVPSMLSDTEQSGLFAGDRDDYVFAGVVYGTENSDESITVRAGDITTVSHDTASGDEYTVYANGEKRLPVDSNKKLYYVYMKRPQIGIVYVKQTVSGNYVVIDEPKRNGSDITLNGQTVRSNTEILMTNDALSFAQSGDGFKVPPNIDGIEDYSLIYSAIGVGTDTAPTDISAKRNLQVQPVDGGLKYRFSDSESWKDFGSDSIVYVVYRENGYNMHITKTVEGGSGDSSFTLTISSDSLSDRGYEVSGYSSATVTPTDGVITLTITGSSDITIGGLPEAVYTLKETNTPDDCEFSAQVNGTDAVISDDQFIMYLNKDSNIGLKNKLPGQKLDIAPTGYTEKVVPYVVLLGLVLTFIVIRRTLVKKRRNDTDSLF